MPAQASSGWSGDGGLVQSTPDAVKVEPKLSEIHVWSTPLRLGNGEAGSCVRGRGETLQPDVQAYPGAILAT